MNHDRTYRPVPYAPALRLRDADNSIRPHTYGVRVCSCTSIATEPCRPTACAGEYPCCTFTHPATAHYSLLTANSSYTFSAKEKDSETGLSYFGSRYYSSDLSVWLSVDPMSDKYPSLSPYTYCADNPVKLVDPNGEEVWIPDEDGNLIAQENDDYKNFNMEKLAVFIISVFCSIHLCLASDTLYLRSNEFSVVRDDYIELYIRIISPNAIEIINTTPDLTICFKVDKKNDVA